MLVLGEITCLHCGHVTGEWVGESGAPLLAAGLRRQDAVSDPSTLLRCGRCEGPVFLDAASAVRSSARLRRIQRLRRQLAAFGDGGQAA